MPTTSLPAGPPSIEAICCSSVGCSPSRGWRRAIDVLPDHLSLVVCGRPVHPEYFRLLTKRARGKDVRFVTDADDKELRELYRHAWATVHPYVYRDCFDEVHQQSGMMGLAALESMSCGTPAIVSDVGALPEFVDDGVTGFVTTSQSELERAINSPYAERGRSIRMGLEANRRVVERLSIGRQAEDVARLYSEGIENWRHIPS